MRTTGYWPMKHGAIKAIREFTMTDRSPITRVAENILKEWINSEMASISKKAPSLESSVISLTASLAKYIAEDVKRFKKDKSDQLEAKISVFTAFFLLLTDSWEDTIDTHKSASDVRVIFDVERKKLNNEYIERLSKGNAHKLLTKNK